MSRLFKATSEQEAVIDAVVRGGDLKIKAYAGAGKTSALRLVADSLASKRGSYLVDEKVHETAVAWLREALLPYVNRLWKESIDPRGRGPVTPDEALKVWGSRRLTSASISSSSIIVQSVDECGTGYLRGLARRITPETDADYVISTVHRAKGLELEACQDHQ
jgi:hypothetical protein